MAHSIKYNFGLNLINTILGLLFPIITFPYISRVLDPDGVGLVAFYSSIINYVVLVSCLGIPLYAIREISRVRANIYERNKTTSEILLLHVVLTLIGYIIVAILCLTVERIYTHIYIFLILSLSIGFTTIGVNWFYQGIEDFKYITIRSVVFKFISLIALFVFVRKSSDVVGYAFVTVIASVGNNILNFHRLFRYFSQCKIPYSELQIMRHLQPALKIFLINLITSIYLNLDSVMLGFMTNDFVVGLYAASSRITHVFLSIITALGSVLLPRLSNYAALGKWDEYLMLKDKAIKFVFTLALPLVFGLLIVTPEFMRVFAGSKYTDAILTVRIMSPIIFFIGLSGILGLQVLYSQGKENLVIICTSVGAAVNFFINLALIPSMQQNGAAVATVIAEFLVLFVMVIIGKKFIRYNYFNKNICRILLSVIIMTICVWAVHILLTHSGISDLSLLAVEVVIGAAVYFCVSYYSKNELIVNIVTEAKHKFLSHQK